MPSRLVGITAINGASVSLKTVDTIK